MSTSDFRGAAYAFKKWMAAAQEDIRNGGEIKPTRRCVDAMPPPRPALVQLRRGRLLQGPTRRGSSNRG